MGAPGARPDGREVGVLSGLCKDCPWYEKSQHDAVGTCSLTHSPELSHPWDPRTESKARVSFSAKESHVLEVDADFGCVQFEASPSA